MQALTEAGLLIAHDTAAEEPTRAADLAALVESVVRDFADQGLDAMVTGPEQASGTLPLRCRKLALTRAISNLVETALRYGRRARLAVERQGGSASVTVYDDGPGLPEGMLERVFEPCFWRGLRAAVHLPLGRPPSPGMLDN